jgi:23S rRNA pseudouridine1911/1915/1917 synthase
MSNGHEHFEWVVGPQDERSRLDHFLVRQRLLGTRSQVQQLIAQGLVRVGERPVKAGMILRAGELVVVERPTRREPPVEPEDIALEVLYEDECLLAIAKPPGLVVHPAPGHWSGTLVNALLHRWRAPAPEFDPSRLGLVHRLDKETSGVLLIAKDEATLAELGRQFRRREIQKSYLAIVWGAVRPIAGVIDRPIGRHPIHRRRMAIRSHGRKSTTRWEVLERLSGTTLMRVRPETGRTHQIRVHLASIGHPVVADSVYSRRRKGEPAGGLERQALHAESITFRHPSTGASTTLSAPLPEDFALALVRLRQGLGQSPRQGSGSRVQGTGR